ncbi:hypothetical protein BC940DRAFT_295491 [Gongronella butleri]|nr:hypothetical protein BC940DRAFT_295491 [Gongronella butleri]
MRVSLLSFVLVTLFSGQQLVQGQGQGQKFVAGTQPMMKVAFLMLIVRQVLADCITCNGCINSHIPTTKNGQPVLYTTKYGNCNVNANSTSFDIKLRNNFNGCGYDKDINDLFQKCASACPLCQKKDQPCTSVFDRPWSKIECPLQPCIGRNQHTKFGSKCCDGLTELNSFCIDPKRDCTPCGQPVESNKPCCSPSGINENGKWRCAGIDTCHTCKADSGCSGSQHCISGCCS